MDTIEKHKKAIINVITGDALGCTLEGFTIEHIKAVYKSINDYTDPEPALKNKLENWKKPGLYTSISQLMILLLASFGKGKFNINSFINNIKSSPEVENSQSGIFRHPDNILNRFINEAKTIQNETADYSASVKLIPICLPFSFQNYFEDTEIYNQFKFCTLFTSDPFTISACLIFSKLIHNIIISDNFIQGKTLLEAGKAAAELLEYSRNNSPEIFELKLNPDNISNAISNYKQLFDSLEKALTLENGIKIIIENLNSIMKNNIKKISIAHPAAAMPLALLKSKFFNETETLLKECVMEGGSASSTASIAGAVSGANGHSIGEESFLIKNLINKKNIISLINDISITSRENINVIDFYKSEAQLTKKEFEEYNSKLKHYKKNEKNVKSRKNPENKMTQHIVESWTKADKAKWKKEKIKINKEIDESYN